VPDLDLRMGLYRRLNDLEDARAIEAFAAEMIDRFGKLPQATENLLTRLWLCKSRSPPASGRGWG
jgi:transcription-repair coupling factor (superfamily II helicase)